MRIMSNIPALLAVNAAKLLGISAERSVRRLAEGLRIGISADDAAGLAISEKLRSQIRGLDQAARNAQDGVSMLQTAEGALEEVHSLLQRMRELSVQAANDTLTLKDRTYIQQEIDQLKQEVDRIASTTQFNRKKLLDGNAAVLWSTDSLDVRVFVDGALRTKDIFGQNVIQEGNYRLRITPTAGEAEVLKTNVFYLKHGTVSDGLRMSPESGMVSGLHGLRSLHLATGEYRLETREVPFGGIGYFDAAGNEIFNPAAVMGVEALEASVLPDIMPYGEYRVRVADEVPFMAHYGDVSGGVFGTEIIDRVDPMGRSNVDLSMDASNVAGPVDSQTRLAWTDIGGAGNGTVNVTQGGGVTPGAPGGAPYPHDPTPGNVVFNVRDDYDANVWTHFRVGAVDPRDTLSGDVNLQTYYRSEAGATANLGLTYQANAGEQVTLRTAFRASSSSSIEITDGTDTYTVVLNSMDVVSARNAINAELVLRGWGTATLTAVGGQQQININNTSGGDLTITNVGGAGDFGLAVANLADGTTHTGTLRDYENDRVVAVGGSDIVAAAAALDGALAAYNIDFAAADEGGGVRHLQISNNSSGAGGIAGSYNLTIMPDAGAVSFETEMGISRAVLLAGNSTSYNRVLHGYTANVNIGNMRVDEVQDALQTAANTAFGLDDLANPGGNVFELVTGGGSGRIDLRTSSVTARYQLTLTQGAGSTVTELFGGNQTLGRNAGDVGGVSRDYDHTYATLAAGRNIEQLLDDIDAIDILSAAWIDAANTPGYDGFHHDGRIRITNTDGSPERREVVFSASNGATQLMGGEVTIGVTGSTTFANTANSRTWQARDQVRVVTNYTGIDRNGNAVDGTRTDWWWEGDVGSSNPLASDGNLPFTSVYIPDRTGATDLAVGDSWALFTSAATVGAHDRLDFRIRDGQTGSTYDSASLGAPVHGVATYGGASMVFNDGMLDGIGGVTFDLPHMFRTGVGTYNTDNSHVSFIQHGFDNIAGATFSDILRTAERYDAAGAGWDVAGQADDRWYARAWYGEDASYYLGDKSPAAVLPPGTIEVWRMEDVNATLLFTATGAGTFHVQGKGYTRAGARVEFEEDIDLNAHGPVSAANQLVLNAGGGAGEVRFDAFAPVGTMPQDRFVVNIAARAGGVYENATPGVPAGFLSDSIITVDADPWGLTRTSHRTMEYRFDSGVEDMFYDDDPLADPDTRLRMFGFFVDPNNSNSVTNVSTGELLLNVAATGFAAGTRAGEGGAGNMPFILAEVNYQGKTNPEAGAIVNSFFFQDQKKGEGERDFLQRVEYAPDETRNAVLLFDVLDERDGGVTLRVQGHVVDRNGEYRYIEAETTGLNNSNEDFVLAAAPGFEGLRFEHFDFTDVTRLRKGDRFTLSLVADGRAEMDPVSQRYAVDEINLFGGDTDPGLYPISWRFFDGVLDDSTTTLRTYQVAPKDSMGEGAFEGKVYDGTLSLSFGSFNGGTLVGDTSSDDTPRVVRDAAVFGSVYREGIDGGVAHRYSTTREVAQFWDKNGRFLLDTPASVVIRQGESEAVFTLYGDEEIQSLLQRLNDTIHRQLGGGLLQNFVPSPSNSKYATLTGPITDKNAMETVRGTMVLRSAIAGSEGAYEFVGDEDILKALGFVVINEAKENMYTVDITDAHTRKTVANGLKVDGGGELRGIWGDAVRLRLGSLLGVAGSQYSEASGRFITAVEPEIFRTVHLADNSTVLQIGANEGEDVLLNFGAMDTKTLGIGGIKVTDRMSAGRSITLVDQAIDRVSRQRATIGSLVNRLGHATASLSVASENLSAADSRLRDLDYAKEMMNFVRIQILVQANNSMMAQANQLPRNVLALLGQ